MKRIEFWATAIFLALTVYFTGVWVNFLTKPDWLPKDMEATAAFMSAIATIIAWAYGHYKKYHEATRDTQKLSAPPHHLSQKAIGRLNELKTLKPIVLNAKQPVVVCGIGGLGKTTFIQMFWDRYHTLFDHVAYISANAVFMEGENYRTDNDAYFLDAFINNEGLKKHLNITHDPQDPPIKQFEKVIAALGDKKGRNLLMIDNASATAASYLGQLSQLDNWRILLTSRDNIQNCTPFKLDVLKPKEAADLFNRIYGKSVYDDILPQILRGIGYHTLTIELIAAYAREKNLSIEALQAELNKRGLRNLDDYDVTVPKSDRIQSLNAHLRDTFFLDLSDDEKDIMRYLSILPPDGADIVTSLMSKEKLSNYFGKNDNFVAFHNVLKGLVKLHWVIERKGAFALHPVIQETTYLQLKPDVENCAVLIKNIIDWFKPDEAAHEPIINRAPFASLGESILKGVYKTDENFKEGDLNVAMLAAWLDNLFRDLGQNYKSLDYSLKALAIWDKVLPTDHPDLASSYNNLAETYRALGQNDKSLEYNQKTLVIREKVLPSDHPNLAQSYNNLAVTYGALGQHDKRLEYNQKALNIWDKVLPTDHPDLASSYNNLAETYRALGENNKSLEYNQKALNIREKVLPPDHPNLAISYNNLALTFGAIGQNDKNLEYNRKALVILEKVLPFDHPHLATSYHNLATTHYNLGDTLLAIKFMQKAVVIREKALPAEHPHVLRSKRDLASFEKILSGQS
jgi:tetratricopeptide (TPR) repeat protein